METYLKETKILNFSDEQIQNLIQIRPWNTMEIVPRVKSIYNFVRDEIKLGYNSADNIAATAVLRDGYGQCNTKANLLMALLRATGIPNRIHGFIVDKKLQKGIISGIWYVLSPKDILHSWVEVYVEERWYALEGVVLDRDYLSKLQTKFKDAKLDICTYGVCVENFKNPPIEWNLNDTYIQNKSITQDLGIFDTPDDFYARHQQKLGVFKKFMYQNIARHRFNSNVAKIRDNN